MIQNNFFLFFLLFSSLTSQIFSTPNFGWDYNTAYSNLYINKNSIFDSRDRFKNLPASLNVENLNYYSLFLGEYFILKNDKENLSSLIQALKSEKGNESNAILLQVFSKLENDSEADALIKIEESLNKEENPILNNLYKTLKLNIKKKSSPEELKESIKSLHCNRQKSFYQVCKTLKLKIQIESIVDNSDYLHRDYLNLDRVIAPFFEEQELFQIPFIEKIIPEIGSKLAYLGFAYEAGFFQRMIVYTQKVSGYFYPSSVEKLAYYEILFDDLNSAEDTMNYILKKTPSSNGSRNSILLKLAAISSFKKDYKQALNYYSDLNFKNWNANEKNPFYPDSLTINQARELIALALWKSKTGMAAVKALNNLQTEKVVTEDNLFIRLRIAQIIMHEKPEVAEKMSEDILYLAQSKAWKRIEYAATNFNGYCNILTNKYRKATVQFTKSYGILGDSDPAYSSEWVRNSGTLFARIMGSERGNHSNGLKYLLRAMKTDEPLDEVLSVKSYIDSRFDTESLYKLAANYFINTKNYASLLETLYSHQKLKSKSTAMYNKSILQVPEVNRRIKYFRGLRPTSENSYYKGDYSKLREIESLKLINDSDKFDSNVFREVHDPILSVFSFNEKIYIIYYDPKTNRWTQSIQNSIDYRTSAYYENFFSLIPSLDRVSTIQIFLNPLGTDLLQALRKKYPTIQTRLFYSFQKNSHKKQELDLVSTALSADASSETISNSVNYFTPEYYEGIKFFPAEDRFHIWNVRDSYSKDINLENYEWKVNSSQVHFKKIFRRADLRTTPNSILIDNGIFSKIGIDSLPIEYYFWSDFWMRKGLKNLYFTDTIDNFQELANILSKPLNTADDFSKIQLLFRNKSKEILILTKDLK